MTDFTRGMRRSYEFWEVSRDTWLDVRRIDCITGGTIVRDLDKDTLGNASFEATGRIGECYVRTYLVAEQDGVTERHCLGTHLLQSSRMTHDGVTGSYPADGYTPLKELAESMPPIGYFVPSGSDAAQAAAEIVAAHCPAPVVTPAASFELSQAFCAEQSDTWLSFVAALIARAGLRMAIDPFGRVSFEPERDASSMRPTSTFDDGSASILRDKMTDETDLNDVPNVVEAVYSSDAGCMTARAVNDDPARASSTVSRGREVVKRITDPDVPDNPTQEQLERFVESKLLELSSVERTVTFSHGFDGETSVGSCVRLDCARSDVRGNFVVRSQEITLDSECAVKASASSKEVR